MRFSNFASVITFGLAALALPGCTESITSTVSRYQAMPAPQGQSFIVVPEGRMAQSGGLEFDRYAGLVAQELQARGFAPASSAQSASMIVKLDYRVGPGQVRYSESPLADPYLGAFYRPRFGWGRGYFLGWNDPFWAGDVDTYVEYRSEVDLHIRSAGTNQPLFDGRAEARSESGRLDVVVPNLLDALFAGFPGRSGEVVKITIPTHPAGH
jgi:hypothetical protein